MNRLPLLWLSLVPLLLLGACANGDGGSSEGDGDRVTFAWDFSEPRTYVYSYTQTVDASTSLDPEDPPSLSRITAEGLLKVKVKDSETAQMVLTDMQMELVTMDEAGAPKDTTTQPAPPVAIQGVRPDGSYPQSGVDFLFGILFPLPPSPLAPGETGTLPQSMPFNANGSRLFIEGGTELTFVGFEEVDGQSCARLDGSIDISGLDIPEELSGSYTGVNRGEGTYFFNVEAGHFVRADIRLDMEVAMDTRGEEPDPMGFAMRMVRNNTFSLVLTGIED